MTSSSQPASGDFLVVYGGPRLELVRLSENGAATLVRATFEDAALAGPRFEGVATSMARAANAKAFRVQHPAPPELLLGVP